MNIKWDKRFLQLAKSISSWSKDESTKVGCVVVDNSRNILTLGYNGLPRKLQDTKERLANRETKYQYTIHAEENAIIHKQQSLEGAVCYTWPLQPCSGCAKKLIQAGIIRVVAPDIPDSMLDRWADDLVLANDMFKEAGVTVDYVQIN